MFVRAVWRLRRMVDVKQTLREMEVPTTRESFGLSGPDFQNMTRGLFDRRRSTPATSSDAAASAHWRPQFFQVSKFSKIA